MSATGVVLVEDKSCHWAGTIERQALTELPAPPNWRKLVHCWRDRQRLPDVQEL